MSIADIVIIGLILIFVLLGLIFGFGKGLKFFTKGFIGVIISIFICYAIGGFIIKISFVANLMTQLYTLYAGLFEGKEGWLFDILISIRVDIIVFYVVLFIVVQVARIIIVKIISKIMSSKNVAIKVVNKIFGVVLFLVAFVFIMVFAFQIIYIVESIFGGNTVIAGFISTIKESKIGGWFYTFNSGIVDYLFKIDGEWIWVKLIEIIKAVIITKEEQIPVEGAIQLLQMYL